MRKWLVSKTRLFYSSFYQIPHVWQYDPQKPLRYLAIYYLQLEREEGGRKRATVAAEHSRDIKVWSTDEASAQHFIATYAIKRSKSFLNATYFLFWNIIFLLTAQCQSFATFVSISRLADNHQQFHDSNFTHLLSFR